MSMKTKMTYDMAASFVGMLLAKKEDRGSLAKLRCGLTDTMRPKMYSEIPQLPNFDTIGDRPCEMAAAMFALHPEHTQEAGNFGVTCRRLWKDKKFETLGSKFPAILEKDEQDFELLVNLVGGLVRMAKTNEIDINYVELLMDLSNWSENETKISWCREFYRNDKDGTCNE